MQTNIRPADATRDFTSQIILTPPAHHEIVIARVLPAPRQRVFDAWTQPEHIMQWWGPHAFTGMQCEVDLRVGGHFRIDLRGPDGLDYPCEGVFHEIVVPERIVYTGIADDRHPCGSGIPPHSRVTVSFDEMAPAETRLTIRARIASRELCDAIVGGGFVPGWRDAFERLEAVLAA